jgi:DNA-binding CsgD family transcriptional regulator
MADQLGISEHTVKFHVAAIYGKLGVGGRAAAVRRALARGLISV